VENKISAVKDIRLTNILLFGLLFLAFFVAAPTTAPADAPLVILRLGHTLAITDPFQVAASKFAEQAAAKTNGKLKVEVYPSAQLGKDRELIEQIKMGTLDMSIQGNNNYDPFLPQIMIFDLPFLFKDRQQAFKALDGPVGQEVYKELLDKQGIRVLSVCENGFRQITTGKKPINSLADVKGMKMRVPETKLYLDTWRALGANPTPITFAELFTALQQGVVDGEENALGLIYASKFQEVQKYLAMVNYIYDAAPLVIGEKKYQSLSPEMQKAISEAAIEARDHQRKFVMGRDNELLSKLREAGMKITYPNRDEFVKAVQPVINEFKKKYGGDRVDRILAGQ